MKARSLHVPHHSRLGSNRKTEKITIATDVLISTQKSTSETTAYTQLPSATLQLPQLRTTMMDLPATEQQDLERGRGDPEKILPSFKDQAQTVAGPRAYEQQQLGASVPLAQGIPIASQQEVDPLAAVMHLNGNLIPQPQTTSTTSKGAAGDRKHIIWAAALVLVVVVVLPVSVPVALSVGVFPGRVIDGSPTATPTTSPISISKPPTATSTFAPAPQQPPVTSTSTPVVATTPSPSAQESVTNPPTPTPPTRTPVVSTPDFLSESDLTVAWEATTAAVGPGNGAFMAPDGSALVVLSGDCTVSAYEPAFGTLLWTFPPTTTENIECLSGVVFSYNGIVPYLAYAVLSGGQT